MNSIDFNNIEIAFVNKTNKQLKKMQLLFKIMNSPKMVKLGEYSLSLALKLHLPIRFIIKPTIFNHFCGGESINDCITTVKQLSNYKIGTILDYSVEGKETEADFEHCAEEIIANIRTAAQSRDIPFCVFKATGIARFELLEKLNASSELTNIEKEEYLNTKDSFYRICHASYESNVSTFIDAEESWIQNAIDNIYIEMARLYNKNRAIVFTTVQLYRIDRLSYMQNLIDIATNENFHIGFKLVRGAYHEKEIVRATEYKYDCPVFLQKEQTDNAYNEALALCISNLSRVSLCSASHNEESNLFLIKLMSENGISNENPKIYFAQLYGMSDNLSYNLANSSYNVAKYVPYGPVLEVIPYLMRRAEENTSISGQSSRELSLIKKEIKRRLLSK